MGRQLTEEEHAAAGAAATAGAGLSPGHPVKGGGGGDGGAGKRRAPPHISGGRPAAAAAAAATAPSRSGGPFLQEDLTQPRLSANGVAALSEMLQAYTDHAPSPVEPKPTRIDTLNPKPRTPNPNP
jgi:hypothetical protein